MSLYQMAIAQIINRANGIRGYTDETRLRGFEFFRMIGRTRSRNLALKARIDKLALCDRISPTYEEGLEIIAVASWMIREEIEQKDRRKAEIEQ
ncbi:hypothetical protein [Coleofasciculus sp. FACHB-129]|uniref:hypothetical protein n=1 Tax=Coleofasciculus sp. FACHB-129 TaxID=2692785 RepID=UPI001A7F034D|nr:hypothetical protein [Coleofasciculus sp. FACHB-129]